MIKYKRPSGSFIEVGDTEGNRALAKELGWVEAKDKPATKAKRKPKAVQDGRDS